ncbi:MAG TPA: hypothetical protein DEB25_08660 [Desulfobulbaceae bacterium]|nr:hypothetical protein [Desulfobulbaceae bacterium]
MPHRKYWKRNLQGIWPNACIRFQHEWSAEKNIALGYSNESSVNQIARSLANIGEEIGNLRNETGITAHGRTMDEIRQRNSRIDEFTKSFLFDSIRTIAIFLIQAFEDRYALQMISQQNAVHEPEYQNCEEFNDYWDDIFGEFKMGEYSFFASEILYSLDGKTYHDERRRFEITDDLENI